MNAYIQKIQQEIEPLRQEIINHKVYGVINNTDSLKIFMQYHVFAVWDFMSLLKSLQNNLTCTSVPWFPVGSADTRFLINEIVVGEESDVDQDGNRISHFELYLNAMKQANANSSIIETFIKELKQHNNLEMAFEQANVPNAAREFVRFTFQTIHTGKPHLQAATFTFGREDLIPNMFHSIINDIDKMFPDSISIFKYYLERHIEVDGGHHSHLALEMTANLCCTDEQYWKESTESTIASLKSRIALWDGVYDEIISSSK
ncbi:MAG: DUF3050 domain-containing protein [Sphingobacteriales bacterium]|nr:DUF3050 domain-containing protein [Sphingobacteriales bacterium]